jgi:amidase
MSHAVRSSIRGLEPAHVLAAALRRGDVTSREIVELYLERIERLNPELNAMVVVDADGARRQADAADARLRDARRREIIRQLPPLHGVPVSIKDMFAVSGLRTTFGFTLLARYVPDYDATVVARLRDAGVVVLGKTNIPEASFDWQCTSPVYGRTNNPWDRNRTPGGSSGGAASAVAAGLSALDIGSDIAGSVRLPAHYCGIYGFKPTEHRVSGAGHGDVREALRQEVRLVRSVAPGTDGARGVRHIVSFGPLARSVDDLEVGMLAIAGSDPQRPDVPPVPVERVHPRELRTYRLAYSAEVEGVPLSRDTRRVVDAFVARLEGAGAMVDHVPPPIDFLEACDNWGSVVGAEMGAALPLPIRVAFRTMFTLRFGRSRWARGFAHGLSDSLHRYEDALALRESLTRRVEGFLSRYDGWILPVASTPAFEHCRTGRALRVDEGAFMYGLVAGALVVPLSLTGQPVLTLPVGHSESGLPIGAQIVSRRWADFDLLALGKRIDEAAGDYQPPPIATQ